MNRLPAALAIPAMLAMLFLGSACSSLSQENINQNRLIAAQQCDKKLAIMKEQHRHEIEKLKLKYEHERKNYGMQKLN